MTSPAQSRLATGTWRFPFGLPEERPQGKVCCPASKSLIRPSVDGSPPRCSLYARSCSLDQKIRDALYCVAGQTLSRLKCFRALQSLLRCLSEGLPVNSGDTRNQDMEEKINILMVDDEPGKLLSYEAMLGELGENLIRAKSGGEALELLLKTDVAVVLLDVSMPEMDGYELADIIHQHPRFQQIPIIFVSALLLSDIDRVKGYRAGAVDYVSVPIIPELLRAKVSVFAELHRRAQQLETLNAQLRRLSGRLIAAQDQERRRIARNLHDSLGQELVAAKMSIDGIVLQDQSLNPTTRAAGAEASAMIDKAIQQVRSVSHLLHPPLLDEVGLLSALRWRSEERR